MEPEENEIIIEALKESSVSNIEKFGYNYNELNGKLANELLDAILEKSQKLTRLDIKGNEFKKSNKEYYEKTLKEKGFDTKILSKYESDDEDEVNDLG